jgi:hypothetical protein
MEGVPFFFSKFVQRMSLFVAPTGGRSGSALCPLWEGAADIAGEGWTALDRRF